MTGRKYKELRDKEKEETKLLKKQDKYNLLKLDFENDCEKFIEENDLVALFNLMVKGNSILTLEGFPLKRFSKYKNEKNKKK